MNRKSKFALAAFVVAAPTALLALHQLTTLDPVCARFGSLYKTFEHPQGGPYVELRAKAGPLFSMPLPMGERAGCAVLRDGDGEIGDVRHLNKLKGVAQTADKVEWRDGEVWLSSTVGLGFSI